MFDGDYSKKVWIITIIMAIGCIAMDAFIWFSDNGFMKDTVLISFPISVYILYKGIEGLIKKIKEEKEGK
jgi:hypothetical protein